MPAKKKEVKKEVAVVNGNKVIRVYTAKDHGRSYKKLAQQFADKKGYQVK